MHGGMGYQVLQVSSGRRSTDIYPYSKKVVSEVRLLVGPFKELLSPDRSDFARSRFLKSDDLCHAQ